MKILLFGPAYPLRGGMAHFIALMFTHLVKRGHDVEIINFTRQYPDLLFPGKTQKESGEGGIPVPSTPLIDSINPLNWLKHGLQLRKRNADLVISTFWLPFFGPSSGTLHKLLRNRRTKTLTLLHNVIPHERRIGDIAFTKYLLRHTDYFIVLSSSVEKDLKSLVAAPRYKMVPHPVYESFGNNIPQEDARKTLSITSPNVLLFFGYIRRYKGLDVLLRALREALKTIDVFLIVAGEFYEDEQLHRETIQKLDLSGHVSIVSEYIPNEKVKQYFSAADCVVLPYLSATQSGIAQIAYNFSTPVIATNVGGLAEVVRNEVTGIVVEPGNVSSLAAAIVRFFQERLSGKFAAGIEEEKKKYSWDNLIDAIEELSSSQK